MLRENELSYIKSRLDFWDQLNESEVNLLINNITSVSYTKGFNLYNS